MPLGSSHCFYRNVVLRKTSSSSIQFAARSASGLFGIHITGILVLVLNSVAIPHRLWWCHMSSSLLNLASMQGIVAPDATIFCTHPDGYLELGGMRHLWKDRYGTHPGEIHLLRYYAIVRSIRLVHPGLWLNTSADSCRRSGAHVAVFLVALKYMCHTSSLSTPQNRLWLALSTLLLACVTASLVLQVRWSWDVERMVEGSGSAFNIARVTLSVCCSVPVRTVE